MDLAFIILIIGTVLIISVFASKIMYRFGVPTLILFLSLGIILGSEGLGGIEFSDYELAANISQVALIFIIFSGGFDTSWKVGKKALPLAFSLSSFGTIITALLVGLFAHFVLSVDLLIGLLLGAIISSTDAASVFSILRSKNLNLKGELATTLEIESGSNDPFAYLLVILFLTLILGSNNSVPLFVFLQLAIGVLVGFAVGYLSVFIINRINLLIDGLYIVIAISFVALSFGLSSLLFGNGYLSVYITGLIMANKQLTHKVSLVRFFDGLTWLMQILLFFTLGLLVFPSQVIGVFWDGLLIALFVSFIARPAAVFFIMRIFKRPFKEMVLLSWVGFRGAASIVFAIFVIMNQLENNVGFYLFNVVFFVAVFSVLLQGTTLSLLANRLKLTENDGSLLTTFSDYRGDTFTELLNFTIPIYSQVLGKQIKELDIPSQILIVMIKRNKEIIIPKANTKIYGNDVLMLASDDKDQLAAFAHLEDLTVKST
jgi:cell volume regulation protein A